MAKSNRKISGKFGNEIYKQGPHGEYISKVGKAPGKVQLEALKMQQHRVPIINKLASQLNKSVEYYDEVLAQRVLFQRVKALLFRQPENERIFMLEHLRGLEVSKIYPLERFNRPPVVSVTQEAENVIVELKIEMHPIKKSSFNCYYFQVVLAYWRDATNDCIHAAKKSSWIFPENGLPAFDLKFPTAPDAKEYVVFVREVRGKDKAEEGLLPERGMMLLNVGSFDKENQERLDAFRLQKEALRLIQVNTSKKVVEEERVEPKSVRNFEL